MTPKVPIAPVIALEGRLRGCPSVLTLGVRPNLSDYSDMERMQIERANRIYYPSTFYAGLFDTIGKETFPSYHTYKYAQDKILQSALFELAGIPQPRTRVFYGRRPVGEILKYFRLPFIAKVARGSSLGKGVFLIRSKQELSRYCREHKPAYIQEYLPIERDIRVVIVGQNVVHAYWRIALKGEYRTNLSVGGQVDLSPVPEAVLEFATEAARRCRWNDVGMDICMHEGRYYVLEGNMKYGREGFMQAGIDYLQMMSDLIQKGEI